MMGGEDHWLVAGMNTTAKQVWGAQFLTGGAVSFHFSHQQQNPPQAGFG